MRHNHIKRLISAALLLAFTVTPSGLATSAYGAYTSSSGASYSSMDMSSVSQLTDKNDKITLSLRDSDVKQVLRMFADKVGMNIVFHSSVNGKVTLDLVDMPINDAFNLVLQVASLNYYKQNNTLIVIAKDNAENAAFSKQEMMIFPVKYIAAAKIANFLNQNVFGMKKAGMSGIDAATVNAATNEIIVFGMPSDAAIVQKVIDQLDREPVQRTFKVNHTTPSAMADMICNMLLPSRGATSGDSGGGGSSAPMPGVSTGGAASASSGEELVLGEGVVACTVSQSASASTAPFDVQNLSVSYFPQRGTITVLGGSEAQSDMIERFIQRNDVKQPQAYLEMSIVELSEEGSKEFQNMWSFSSKNWNFSFNGASVSGGRDGSGMYPRTEYIWDTPTNEEYPTPGQPQWVTEGDKKVVKIPQQIKRVVYDTVGVPRVYWAMRYLIDNRKARVLANPKLIITNGQESTLDLTQDYVEKVTSEFLSSNQNGQGSTGTVQRTYTIGKDKGIKVSLMPFISPDGYVTLNIKPEYAVESGQVSVVGETGYTDTVATLLARRNLDLKNVRIKDGETLVLGGLIQEAEQKSVQKIPVLGDLPLVGSAFRSQHTARVKSELVIMITPRIINDGDGAVADNL